MLVKLSDMLHSSNFIRLFHRQSFALYGIVSEQADSQLKIATQLAMASEIDNYVMSIATIGFTYYHAMCVAIIAIAISMLQYYVD